MFEDCMKWCDQGLNVIANEQKIAESSAAKNDENRKKLNDLRIKAEIAKVSQIKGFFVHCLV
jgi:hypothetical protein